MNARTCLQLPQWLLIALVRAYRLLISPALPSACRFDPTCSAYTLLALQRHGACAGSYLGVRRILRCHPGCAGGHDPVPNAQTRVFSFFLWKKKSS